MKQNVKWLSAMLALFLVITMLPISGMASAIGNIGTTDEGLTTVQEAKENRANDKYTTLLTHWAYDKEHIDDVYADFPSFYGGAYINDDQELVIQVTNSDAETINYFKNLIDLTDVKFEKVIYSYSTLVAELDAATSRMTDNDKKFTNAVSALGISIPKNSLNIYVVADDVAKNQLDIQAICKSVTTFENINVVEVGSRDVPCGDVYPGSELSTPGGNRSVGFWAYDANSNLGFITAPHDSMAKNDLVYINGTTFGRAATPYFSGGVDAVFVKRSNTSLTPTRYVSGHGTSHASGTYKTLAVGSTIYSRGKDSGARSGKIQDTSYTVTYELSPGENFTLGKCVLTSAYCQEGDSGGIVVGGGNSGTRYIVGIITGRRMSNNYLIYVKAGTLLQRLGCTIY